MKRTNSKLIKYRFLTSAVLLAVSFALYYASVFSGIFATWYCDHIYLVISEIFSSFSGIFPFSLAEFLLYAILVWLPVCIISGIVKAVRARRMSLLLRPFSAVLLAASVLIFLFTVNCGINYRAESFSERYGIENKRNGRQASDTASAGSDEELIRLCGFLTEKVNEEYSGAFSGEINKSSWPAEGSSAMTALGRTYPRLSGSYPRPKALAFSYLLSVQQLCGIYSPFTVEANYNRDMPDYNIPFTLCHELSHLRGFMREDESNFISYLACIGSDDAYFRYSGYLSAWVYAGNALAAEDPDTYRNFYKDLNEQAVSDLKYNNEFWAQYEGKAAETQEKLNDAYLKTNGQKEGVRSYNRFVELLLAYYSE